MDKIEAGRCRVDESPNSTADVAAHVRLSAGARTTPEPRQEVVRQNGGLVPVNDAEYPLPGENREDCHCHAANAANLVDQQTIQAEADAARNQGQHEASPPVQCDLPAK